jgi:hypothetical protein
MSLLGTLVDITAFTRVSLCVLLVRNRPGIPVSHRLSPFPRHTDRELLWFCVVDRRQHAAVGVCIQPPVERTC